MTIVNLPYPEVKQIIRLNSEGNRLNLPVTRGSGVGGVVPPKEAEKYFIENT
jgi:hypothetical protein